MTTIEKNDLLGLTLGVNPINPSDYAFPVAATSAHAQGASGLTKREYLAAKMMAALVSTLSEDEQEHPLDLQRQSKSFAIAAVAYADALITELNKPSLPSKLELEAPAPSEYTVPLPTEPDYPVDYNPLEPEE